MCDRGQEGPEMVWNSLYKNISCNFKKIPKFLTLLIAGAYDVFLNIWMFLRISP